MPSNLKLSTQTVDAEGDALSPLFNNGYLRIYSGTQPTDANTAVGAQLLLAELRFAATAMLSSIDGILTANPLVQDDNANNTGTASWYRCLQSNGTTAICDGSVGTSGCDLNMNSVNISQNAVVAITSFTHTIPKSL